MSGYAYQMNAALDKIQRLQAEIAQIRQQHEALVLENTSLRHAVEDMAGLREENLLLKGRLEGYRSGIEQGLKRL